MFLLIQTREKAFLLLFFLLNFQHILEWVEYLVFLIYVCNCGINIGVILTMPQKSNMEIPVEARCLFQ